MKKTVITLSTFLLFVCQLFSQNVNIPDEHFLAALLDEGVDANEDGQISYAEAEVIDSLEVSGKYISDLTGIETFVNLEYLDCSSNSLDSLDMSGNASLVEFTCTDNRLQYLIISNNTELRILNCIRNTINSLDVTANTALEQLHCAVNFLNSLDVSTNLVLSELDCSNNQLDSLDVSKNLALGRLVCSDNNLTSLDLSKNGSLEHLDCSNNRLAGLDLSNNTSIIYLNCHKNELTNLDLSNNTALAHVICHDNQLVSMDVSNITALVRLDCRNTQLTSLDISTNTNLEGLNCSQNYLNSLDISNNTFLGSGDEDWQSIDISFNPTLSEVCVWTMPFPPANVKIFYHGSPNIYFTAECTSGFEESSVSHFYIYPNPANSHITIKLDQTEKFLVEITSLNSEIIYSKEMEGPANQLDISSFQKGVYYITIRSKERMTTKKIIKL